MIRHGPDWRRWQLEAGEDLYREHAFVCRRGDDQLRILVEERSFASPGSPFRARVTNARDPRANSAMGQGNSLEAALDSLLNQLTEPS